MKVSGDPDSVRVSQQWWLIYRVGILSAFMAFIEPGDEVIVFEPFFDQ